MFFCSINCSDYRKFLLSFHEVILVFARGNGEWWKDGLGKEQKDVGGLSGFLHCALCRFLTLNRGSPTTLPGGSCYTSIRDGETEAQRDKARCAVSE